MNVLSQEKGKVMLISNYIKTELGEDSTVSVERFGDIIIYLLHYGVICRPTSGTHSEGDYQKELDLYDDFLVVENEIRDYLSIIGINIKINRDFETIRIYPPDADYPDNPNVVDYENASTLMRMSISKDLAASLIVLYLLYEQHKNEQNEDFTVAISQVQFMNSFRSKLNLDLAEILSKNSKRKEDLFKELKRLRIIKYHRDFFNSEDQYPIVIRPTIYDLVPENIIKDVLDDIENMEGSIENV